MASILPTAPTRPSGTIVTDTIYATTAPTVDAATTLVGSGLTALYRAVNDYLLLTNAGTIWFDTTSGLFTGYRTSLDNSGSIYVSGLNGYGLLPQSLLTAYGSDYWTVRNSGTIWAVAGTTGLTAIFGDIEARVYNSGLIVVESTMGSATGISSYNDGHFFNAAGGRLLVEGTTKAVAFSSANGAWGMTLQLPLVDNRGLIEAHATAPDGYSIGILVAHSSGAVAKIVNSGTIRADYAVIGDVNTTTQQVVGPIEHIANLAGGLIEGDFFLDTGDDIVENAGTIRGVIDMGEGADHVSGAGVIVGIVDMGWDNDLFDGSGFADKVAGGRDNDRLNGNGGNDLLLGGFGEDSILGGAGNDGLFGEWGRDTLTLSGGDYADGGDGNDRLVLTDYNFEAVLGGPGIDTLVFAAGARNFDLGAMQVTQRVGGIEAVELQASQTLTIRSKELHDLIDSGTTFRVVAGASNTISLDGAWTRGANMTIDGKAYEVWTLGGYTVQVTETATVSAGAAPVFGGFDSVSGGDAALRPGATAGLDFTNPETYFAGYELSHDFTIADDEVFWTDGSSPVFFAQSGVDNVVIDGELLSVNESSDNAKALIATNYTNVTNNGLVYVDALGQSLFPGFGSLALGVSVGSFGRLTNTGVITVYSADGNATGAEADAFLTNSGVIEAYADKGVAVGVVSPGTDGLNLQRFTNSGEIYAQGKSHGMFGFGPVLAAAIGVKIDGGDAINAGVITAELAPGAMPDELAIGMWLWQYTGWSGNMVTNSGTISGDIAVRFVGDNSNSLSSLAFKLVNTGTLDGEIWFGNGADRLDSAGGTTNGLVRAYGGNDTLTGGASADRFDAGTGDDTMTGGGNIDTALFAGNRADYTVTQTSTGMFKIVGPDGTDVLNGIEYAQFGDETLRLRPGNGASVNFESSDPATYRAAMANIRDFDGNALGGNDGWLRIGAGDVNGDGDMDQILVNKLIGRFAEVGMASDGMIYFSDHGWAGETRVVGIYIDPLVQSGEVVAGGPFDSQRRFQNDLQIENINRVLGAGDYDHDGLQELYLALTDRTAYLHAYLHSDGNIRYANYQSEAQVIDYLTQHGFGAATWDGWFT